MFFTFIANQTVPDIMVGFKSNTGWGLVLLSLEFPEGAVLRLGLSMNRIPGLLWIRTFSH